MNKCCKKVYKQLLISITDLEQDDILTSSRQFDANWLSPINGGGSEFYE